jgi:enterochelin esterase-like enzyme
LALITAPPAWDDGDANPVPGHDERATLAEFSGLSESLTRRANARETYGIAIRIATACLALALAICGCGSTAQRETLPSGLPGAMPSELTFESGAVGMDRDVSVIEPVGAAPPGGRPLLVFLHAAGGSDESYLENAAIRRGLARLGARAPLLAFPDGGDNWWHDRESGDWARYVVREVIPAIIRRYDTDPRRVAIGGISMGGFGAYHLGLLHPRRFCAVGGHSAGLWLDPSEEFPGAFDDDADYERNDILDAVREDPGAFGPTPVWNDYGDEDWFVAGNAAFVDALKAGDADLTARVWSGGHDSAYWDRHWPAYLRFYANSLASCR